MTRALAVRGPTPLAPQPISIVATPIARAGFLYGRLIKTLAVQFTRHRSPPHRRNSSRLSGPACLSVRLLRHLDFCACTRRQTCRM
jgi:hypothetical protein